MDGTVTGSPTLLVIRIEEGKGFQMVDVYWQISFRVLTREFF
jgi:hypothetical protein